MPYIWGLSTVMLQPFIDMSIEILKTEPLPVPIPTIAASCVTGGRVLLRPAARRTRAPRTRTRSACARGSLLNKPLGGGDAED